MSRKRILISYLLNFFFCIAATFAGCAALLDYEYYPFVPLILAFLTPVVAPLASPFIVARAAYLAILRPELLEWWHLPGVVCLPTFCALVYTAIKAIRYNQQRNWLIASHILLAVFWASGTLVTQQTIIAVIEAVERMAAL